MAKFQKGDAAYVKNVGCGLVSYEKFTVEKVRAGKVKLDALSYWFDAETGRGPGDPAGLGLTVTLCASDDDIRRAEEYEQRYSG